MTESQSLSQLKSLLKTLLKDYDNLKSENVKLKALLNDLKGSSNFGLVTKVSKISDEVQHLKLENKILKEKEKLIRNKMERLAVKLDEIEW